MNKKNNTAAKVTDFICENVRLPNILNTCLCFKKKWNNSFLNNTSP